MKIRLFSICWLIAVIGLTACGKNERPEYQGADYYKSLELPPDLTLEKSTAEMDIPEPTSAALEDFQSRHKLNKAVAPEFKGIRLKHDGSMYFLEVDAAPEVVWPRLEAFWEHEGIRLQQNRPMLGFMQTDWTKQMQVEEDANYLVRLFSKLEPDFRDKFRMRVEPAEDRTKTHIFVAHYGIEVFVEISGDDQGSKQWRARPSDIELEREILSRLTLYAGLSENQAESLLLDYKPMQYYVTLPAYDERKADTVEGEEESGANWFTSWFKDEPESKKPSKAEDFVLVLAEQPGYVDFMLLDSRGQEASTASAAQVRAALAKALE